MVQFQFPITLDSRNIIKNNTFTYGKICGELVDFAENYTTYLQKQPFVAILQKDALKNFKYSHENTCVGVSF